MSKSNLGDTAILNDTMKATNDRGFNQLKYKLPSGRTVVSEWIDPNQLKGQVFIQWCNVVRDQDEADIMEREAAEEAAAAAKQRRLAISPAPSTEHVPVPSENLRSSRLGSEVLSAETLPASLTPSSTIKRAQQPFVQRTNDALPDDPTDLAIQKLNALLMQRAEIQDQLSALSSQATQLEQAISRWETVVASLRGNLDVPSPPQSEKRLIVPSANLEVLKQP